MMRILFFTLNFISIISTITALELPVGTSLVSFPCSGSVTTALGEQATKVTSLWHISRDSRQFTHYSGNGTSPTTPTQPIASLKAHQGYYATINEAFTFTPSCSSEPFPDLSPHAGWQLRNLVGGANPISITDFLNANTPLNGQRLHAIITLVGNQWLSYVHEPNALSSSFYGSLSSTASLTELTPSQAYWIAYGPTNTFDIVSKSGADRLSRPQFSIGDKAGVISRIHNSTAYIKPLSGTFTFSDWPDAFKIQLSPFSRRQSYDGQFNFDLRNSANPSGHFAFANTPGFEIQTLENGSMGAYIGLNSTISAAYQTLDGSSASITGSQNSSGGFGDTTDGATSTNPQRLAFAIRPYTTKAGDASDSFKGHSLTITFDLPNLNFSQYQQPIVTRFVVENLIIENP